jgi:DNA recombination protein RmuC
MSFEILIIFAIIVGFVVLFFAIKNLLVAQKSSELEAVVDRVFGMSAQKITEATKQVLESDKEAIHIDLKNKQQTIEKLVGDLRRELNENQEKNYQTEKSRVKEFGSLLESLTQHKELTKELQISTQTLAKVLDSNQDRGKWGERIIEDLLIDNGLHEGVHYQKQRKLGNSGKIPDITLLMPNSSRVVAVDVKFPYSEMQKMSLAESKQARAMHLRQFEQDLKTKVTEVAKYIDAGQDTLDYAIMFVPNESVFAFINQKLPHIVDLALSKRVLMVSPFTFLIVARTVMESYRNFMIGDKLKDVVKHVDDFVAEWDKFKDEFTKYGSKIETLQRGYENLTGARVRVMDKKVSQVQKFSSGDLLEVEGQKKLGD